MLTKVRFLSVSSLLLLCIVAFSAVYAEQPWTIQTVAFRDYRDADAEVTRLRNMGFDAYTEFAMYRDKQYARVRVGCFWDRDGAEALAAELRTHSVDDAVIQLFSPRAPATVCVEHDLGFLTPDTWRVHEQNAQSILFAVEVAGQDGYIAFNGRDWRVFQDEQALQQDAGWLASTAGSQPPPHLTPVVPYALEAEFSTQSAHITARYGEHEPLIVATGEILWQSRHAVVVKNGASVTAITLSPIPD